MKKEDTIKGNRLIYEFLHPNLNVRTYFDEKAYNHYCWRKGYHGNWQSLINIIEQIEHMGSTGFEVCIIDKECEIGTMGYQYNCIALGKGETKKEAVYKAIIEFINYYNDKL